MRLIELAEIPFDRIEGTALGIMALRVLKAERAKDLLNDSVWDEALLGRVWEESPGDLRMLLLYMFHADIDKKAFRSRVETITHPEIREKAMSVAEQLRQEGRQEGQRRAIEKILKLRHKRVPLGLVEALGEISAEKELDRLLTAAATCATLEEFTEGL